MDELFIDLEQDMDLRLEDVPVRQIITNDWAVFIVIKNPDLEQNNIMLKITTEKGINVTVVTADNLGYVKQLQEYIFLRGGSVVYNCLF